jgi:hypothetical protein
MFLRTASVNFGNIKGNRATRSADHYPTPHSDFSEIFLTRAFRRLSDGPREQSAIEREISPDHCIHSKVISHSMLRCIAHCLCRNRIA